MARRDHIHIDGAGPGICGGVLGRHSHETDSLGYIAVFYKPVGVGSKATEDRPTGQRVRTNSISSDRSLVMSHQRLTPRRKTADPSAKTLHHFS